jgi:hypothetical protein
MELSAQSGEIISLEEAKQYTHAFQKRNPDEKKAFFVGSINLRKILEQPGCTGIRIYNGYCEAEETQNRVLIGVDAKGNDIEEGIILDKLAACPPLCSGTPGL